MVTPVTAVVLLRMTQFKGQSDTKEREIQTAKLPHCPCTDRTAAPCSLSRVKSSTMRPRPTLPDSRPAFIDISCVDDGSFRTESFSGADKISCQQDRKTGIVLELLHIRVQALQRAFKG